MTNEEAMLYLENALCELDAGIKVYRGTVKEEFIEQRKCFITSLSALREQAEIVRCSECQHYPEKDCFGNDCCNMFVRHNTVLIPRKLTDYCSYGERRESEVSE